MIKLGPIAASVELCIIFYTLSSNDKNGLFSSKWLWLMQTSCKHRPPARSWKYHDIQRTREYKVAPILAFVSFCKQSVSEYHRYRFQGILEIKRSRNNWKRVWKTCTSGIMLFFSCCWTPSSVSYIQKMGKNLESFISCWSVTKLSQRLSSQRNRANNLVYWSAGSIFHLKIEV